VRDAGRYDGTLGLGVALGALARLARDGSALPFAVEVLAFGDEEGVRFPQTLTSSKAVAGRFDRAVLGLADRDGVTYEAALRAFGGDPASIAAVARRPADVLGYIEVHIEQGPVLEAEGLPVGIVSAIAGATRWRVEVEGFAGHAGTVPMALRRDALAAAAEMIVAIEGLAHRHPGVVATVGVIEARPGAVNVIPGAASFALDFRSVDDDLRERLGAGIRATLEEIAARRGVAVSMTPGYDEKAAPCHPAIVSGLEAAVARAGVRPLRLSSGAGHDALSISGFCPMGMLFVRCEKGISHNPAEAVAAADVEVAIGVLADFLANLDPASLAD
jgi:allantoate deiminase